MTARQRPLGFDSALYKALVEAAPDALVVVDESGVIVLANAQAEALFGYARDELLGSPVDMLLPEAARRRHAEHVKNFFRAPRARPMGAGIELRARHKQGHEFPVEISLSPVVSEQGLFVASAIRDVSQRKRAEVELEKRVRQQSAIAQLGVSALRSRDIDQLMQEAALAVKEALQVEYSKVFEVSRDRSTLDLRAGAGWRPGFVGRVSLPADAGFLAGYTLQSNQPVITDDLRLEERFRAPDFLLEHGVQSSLTVIIHGDNGPFGVLGVDSGNKRSFSPTDIATVQAVANLLSQAIIRLRIEHSLDQLNAQLEARVEARAQALKVSEERFSKAFHANPTPTFIVDLKELRFIDANSSFLELVGHERQEVIAATVYQLSLLVEVDRRAGIYDRLRAGHALENTELTIRTRHRGSRTVVAAAEPIELGARRAALFTLVDITERKRTEEELMRAIQASLQDAEKFSRAIMDKLVDVREASAGGEAVKLTKRESEVLSLVAQGWDNTRIAAKLELAPQTVHNYLSRLYEKLDVGTRAEVIVWARKRGYLGRE